MTTAARTLSPFDTLERARLRQGLDDRTGGERRQLVPRPATFALYRRRDTGRSVASQPLLPAARDRHFPGAASLYTFRSVIAIMARAPWQNSGLPSIMR
jgi:hypothetical protein